jgi:hypothetical protein
MTSVGACTSCIQCDPQLAKRLVSFQPLILKCDTLVFTDFAYRFLTCVHYTSSTAVSTFVNATLRGFPSENVAMTFVGPGGGGGFLGFGGGDDGGGDGRVRHSHSRGGRQVGYMECVYA